MWLGAGGGHGGIAKVVADWQHSGGSGATDVFIWPEGVRWWRVVVAGLSFVGSFGCGG